mmetsp:Transcript_115959/g.334858  ORF Transcript_115959/g.334858 Transcript_115959/m.334858 type:complete len:230 (-) Transcript_115959:917-1606(-)
MYRSCLSRSRPLSKHSTAVFKSPEDFRRRAFNSYTSTAVGVWSKHWSSKMIPSLYSATSSCSPARRYHAHNSVDGGSSNSSVGSNFLFSFSEDTYPSTISTISLYVGWDLTKKGSVAIAYLPFCSTKKNVLSSLHNDGTPLTSCFRMKTSREFLSLSPLTRFMGIRCIARDRLYFGKSSILYASSNFSLCSEVSGIIEARVRVPGNFRTSSQIGASISSKEHIYIEWTQ